MSKIVVECTNPNDIEAVEAAVENAIGRCNITYHKQANLLLEGGIVKSERAAARKIAEETGEALSTVRKRIYIGKAEMDTAVSKQETLTNPTPCAKLEKLEKPLTLTNRSAFDRVIDETRREDPVSRHGGPRPGSGRKQKEVIEKAPYISNNEQFVMLALLQLERINDHDPKEAIAMLDRVVDWVEKRIAEIKNNSGE